MIRAIPALLLALATFLPSAAAAHLLHEQNGTMKIVDNSANFVISVPVSALEGVDQNGDGLLSPVELEAGRDRIIAQFMAQFDVFDGEAAGRKVLTWVVSPETHQPDAATSYVVVMQRVFFNEEPSSPRVVFNLFGEQPGEREMSLRATHGEKSETVIFTPDNSQHTFFRGGIAALTTSLGLRTNGGGRGFRFWQILIAVLVSGAACFTAYRLRPAFA